MTIHLLLEGYAAEHAVKDLSALPGLTVDVPKPTETTKEPVALAVVASIVGIIGGAVAIADQIVKWRDRWQGRGGDQVTKIIIIVDGKRKTLDDSTAGELAELLSREFGPAE